MDKLEISGNHCAVILNNALPFVIPRGACLCFLYLSVYLFMYILVKLTESDNLCMCVYTHLLWVKQPLLKVVLIETFKDFLM